MRICREYYEWLSKSNLWALLVFQRKSAIPPVGLYRTLSILLVMRISCSQDAAGERSQLYATSQSRGELRVPSQDLRGSQA